MTRNFTLLSVLILVLAGCATDTAGSQSSSTEANTTATDASAPVAEGKETTIVVTTSILGDMVSDLVAEDAAVEVLMPRGADPHEFSVSAAQAASMREADLLVVNGLALEGGMLDAIEAAEEDGANVFEAASVVDTIEFEGEHAHGDEHADEDHSEDEHADEDHSEDEHAGEDHSEDEHADEDHSEDEHADEDHSEDEHAGEEHAHEGGADPHFWMDPARLSTSVQALGAEIAEADDTLEDAEWEARTDEIVAMLADLDAEVSDILAEVPDDQRVLVTNHEAFGYFADAYDFEIVGTVIPGGSTLAEPSAADLKELVDTITAEGVGAVFAENTDPSRLAEVVADEAGADVKVGLLFSDSLSPEDGPASTYPEYMRYNATTIADALTGA